MKNRSILPTSLLANPNGSVYHLNLLPGELAETIILVGDPERVSKVSQHFDRVEVKKSKREFVTHTGYIDRQRLSVISTGMGACNIEIAINEIDALFNIDIANRTIKKELTSLNFVRLGTCGCVAADVKPGELVISQSGLGFDGLLKFYQSQPNARETSLLDAARKHFSALPIAECFIAAEADEALLNQFSEGAHSGITLTCSGFYGAQGRQLRAPIIEPNILDLAGTFEFNGQRILNFEMETTAIYYMANLLGHKACSISTVIANRVTQEICADSDKAVANMIECALKAQHAGFNFSV